MDGPGLKNCVEFLSHFTPFQHNNFYSAAFTKEGTMNSMIPLFWFAPPWYSTVETEPRAGCWQACGKWFYPFSKYWMKTLWQSFWIACICLHTNLCRLPEQISEAWSIPLNFNSSFWTEASWRQAGQWTQKDKHYWVSVRVSLESVANMSTLFHLEPLCLIFNTEHINTILSPSYTSKVLAQVLFWLGCHKSANELCQPMSCANLR